MPNNYLKSGLWTNTENYVWKTVRQSTGDQ